MILKVSLLFAFAGFLISFGISFQALGLDQGMVIHERLMDEHRIESGEQILSFSADGQRTYGYFSNHYGNLTFFFVLVILAQLLEMTLVAKLKVVWRIISFGSLLIILNMLRNDLREISYVEPFVWDALQTTVAKSWLHYPWILGGITLTIVFLQLVALVPWLGSKKMPEVIRNGS